MQELPFLHSACRLMLVDICMKFHDASLYGFQVTERTRFVTDRQTDRRTPFGGRHNLSFGAVYRRIYVRKLYFTAPLTRRCKTKFPTVYTTIYLPK